MRKMRVVLSLATCLACGCNEPSGADGAPSPSAAAPTGAAPVSKPASPQKEDVWFQISKDGHDLGVVEITAGRPWKWVPQSAGDAAKEVEAKLKKVGTGAVSLKMHLPPKNKGERGPLGARMIQPGEALYPQAVRDQIARGGFEIGNVPKYTRTSPPASIKKLELSRDGDKAGEVDFSVDPPKLELVNREANALFLETFWKGLEKEEELVVSFIDTSAGKERLVTRSAKKGTAEYPKIVWLAFGVRYPAYSVKVTP